MDVIMCKTVVWYTGLSSSNRLKIPFKILGVVAIMRVVTMLRVGTCVVRSLYKSTLPANAD